MKLDIDKLHKDYLSKSYRRSGKTVDAIVDAIGKILATQYNIVPYFVREIDWDRHVTKTFFEVAKEVFNEEPYRKGYDLGLLGYSTRIRIVSMKDSISEDKLRGFITTDPIYDTH